MKNKKRNAARRRSGDSSAPLSLLRQSVLATLTALLLSIPVSFLAALICYKTGDPLSLVPSVGTALCFLAYLLSGILAALKTPDAPIPSGILSGIALSLLLLFGGMLLGGSSLALGLLLKLIGIVFSIVGAYLTALRKRSHRRAKRHSHGRT